MSSPSAARRFRTLVGRDADEPTRISSPLELFVDLCFVAAVSQAATAFRRSIVLGHVSHALWEYAAVFFAVWWAWLNFAWFASAYDNDDLLYRLATFVEAIGVLTLAVGVSRAFSHNQWTLVFAGYVIMRVVLILQWLRAAASDPARRRGAIISALGMAGCQVLWTSVILDPSQIGILFPVCAAIDMMVPIAGQRAARTPWHPGHIVDRYSLFTIIVLGEAVVSVAIGEQSALAHGTSAMRAVLTGAEGLAIVFAMWWHYFGQDTDETVRRARTSMGDGHLRRGFIWGYGHFVVFAAAAAIGAGIVTAVGVGHHGSLSETATAVAVAIPTAVFFVVVGLLNSDRGTGPLGYLVLVVGAALELITGALGGSLFWLAVVTAVIVAADQVACRYAHDQREAQSGDAPQL